MKINIYNQKGEMIQEREIPKEIFGVVLNKDLIYQVYTSFLSNQRRPLAFAKDRSEVRGGGKKPWAQKGTGRARQGSIRSPLWKGGGATFGPRQREENFTRKINKKMKQASIKMALSQKIKDQEVKVIDNFDLKEMKTKEMNSILNNIFQKDSQKSILVLLNSKEQMLRRVLRNLPQVQIMNASDVNILNLLNNKFVLFSQDTLNNLEKQLA